MIDGKKVKIGPDAKEMIISKAVETACNALASAFMACELETKISGTIEIDDTDGNPVRFAISFEKLITK